MLKEGLAAGEMVFDNVRALLHCCILTLWNDGDASITTIDGNGAGYGVFSKSNLPFKKIVSTLGLW